MNVAFKQSDAEFDEQQFRRICLAVSNELRWQIVELLIHAVSVGQGVDFVIKKILILEQFGVSIDKVALDELRRNYNGDTNTFRRPEVFVISEDQFDNSHRGMKEVEQILKLKENPRWRNVGMPSPRAQFRRACITKQAYLVLDAIKKNYDLRYAEKGVAKFNTFLKNKVLAEDKISEFIFRRKPRDTQKDDPDHDYETFYTVRNTARRNERKKWLASPVYKVSYSRLSKIRGVIMPASVSI